MRGASAIQSALQEFPNQQLRVFVVWERVLPTDWAAPFTATLSRISDPRAIQFWDRDGFLSLKMRQAGPSDPAQADYSNGFRMEKMIWDFVAIFPPGARWDGSVSQAEFTGAPVTNAIEEVRRHLARRIAMIVRSSDCGAPDRNSARSARQAAVSSLGGSA